MAEAKIRVGIFGHDAGFGRSLDSAWRKADTFGKKMDLIGRQMQGMGKMMSIGVTLPIVAGFALAVTGAIAEEKEIALLSKALVTNAKATKAQVAATEQWVTKMQNATGIADGELRPALAALVAVTKDTGKAQDLLGVAMDIAAAKGKPLATVTAAMAKAYLGNVGALGRLGIATKDFSVDSTKAAAARAALQKAEENLTAVLKDSDKTAADRAVATARVATAHDTLKKALSGTTGVALTFEDVMKNAVKTYGGAAATAADTTAGKMAILKAKIADLAEELGTTFIPYIQDAVKWLTKAADWASTHKDFLVKALGSAAAAGPILYVTGTVMRLIGALEKLSAMKVAVNFAGLAGGGVGGLIAASIGIGISAAVAGVVAVEVVKGIDEGIKQVQDKGPTSTWGKWDTFWTGFFTGLKDGATDASNWLDEALGGGAGRRYTQAWTAASASIDGLLKTAWGQQKMRLTDMQADLAKAFEIPEIKTAVQTLDFTPAKGQLKEFRNLIVSNLHVPLKEASAIVRLLFPKQFAAEFGTSLEDKVSRWKAKVKELQAAIAKKLRWGDLDVGDLEKKLANLQHKITEAAQSFEKKFAKIQFGHGIPVSETGAGGSLAGKAKAAVNSAVSAAKGIAAKRSPAIGAAIATGAAAGVMANSGLLADRAAQMVTNAMDAARTAAQATSPSKVMMKLGADMAEGLALGIIEGQKRVRLTAVALAGAVRDAIAAGDYGSRTGSLVHRRDPDFVSHSTTRMENLLDLASRGQVLIDALAAIKSQIVDLTRSIMATVDLWPQYVETVDELGNKVRTLSLPTVEVVNAADMGAVMDANVANMQAWVANMDKLRAAGMPKELLDELTAMGMGGAGQVAGLASMTAEQLAKWTKGWLELQALAGTQAKATFKDAADAAVSAINAFTIALLNALAKLSGTGSVAGTGGTIPKLAAGGIVTRPTLALVGEGGPEAVVPLRGMGSSSSNRIIVNQHNSFAIYALEPDDRLVARFAQKLQTVSHRAAQEMARKVPR